MLKGTFQPTECHAQYVNWADLAGSHRSLLRDGLGSVGGEPLCCASLVFSGFYSSLFLSIIIINYYYYILLYLNYKIVLISK